MTLLRTVPAAYLRPRRQLFLPTEPIRSTGALFHQHVGYVCKSKTALGVAALVEYISDALSTT